MSKNKKTQKRRQTKPMTTAIAPAKTKLKPNTITIFLCICIICCTFGGLLSIDAFGWRVPKEPDAIAEYLYEKYNEEFIYVDSPMGCHVYATKQEPYREVAVYPSASIEAMMPEELTETNKDYLHETFADNGYSVMFAEDIANYYKTFIKEPIGNHKFLTDFSTLVLPHAMDGSKPYQSYLTEYSDFFSVTFFVLTDVKLTHAQCQSITNSFEKCPYELNIVFIYAEKDTQPNITLSMVSGPWLQEEDILLQASINYDTGWDEKAFAEYVEQQFGDTAQCIMVDENSRQVVIDDDNTAMIYQTSYIKDLRPDLSHLYTDPFANDVHLNSIREELNVIYQNTTDAVLPNAKTMVVPQLPATPSLIQNISTEEVISQYPNLFSPFIFILTDASLSDEQKMQIQEQFTSRNESMTVAVFKVDNDEQKNLTEDDLVSMWLSNSNLIFELQVE